MSVVEPKSRIFWSELVHRKILHLTCPSIVFLFDDWNKGTYMIILHSIYNAIIHHTHLFYFTESYVSPHMNMAFYITNKFYIRDFSKPGKLWVVYKMISKIMYVLNYRYGTEVPKDETKGSPGKNPKRQRIEKTYASSLLSEGIGFAPLNMIVHLEAPPHEKYSRKILECLYTDLEVVLSQWSRCNNEQLIESFLKNIIFIYNISCNIREGLILKILKYIGTSKEINDRIIEFTTLFMVVLCDSKRLVQYAHLMPTLNVYIHRVSVMKLPQEKGSLFKSHEELLKVLSDLDYSRLEWLGPLLYLTFLHYEFPVNVTGLLKRFGMWLHRDWFDSFYPLVVMDEHKLDETYYQENQDDLNRMLDRKLDNVLDRGIGLSYDEVERVLFVDA